MSNQYPKRLLPFPCKFPINKKAVKHAQEPSKDMETNLSSGHLGQVVDKAVSPNCRSIAIEPAHLEKGEYTA
jgi:hypothetical protein